MPYGVYDLTHLFSDRESKTVSQVTFHIPGVIILMTRKKPSGLTLAFIDNKLINHNYLSIV